MSKPSMEDPAVAALVEKHVKAAKKGFLKLVVDEVKATEEAILTTYGDRAIKKEVKGAFKNLLGSIKEAA